MSLIIRLIGILFLSAGLVGLMYTTDLFDGVVAYTQASIKFYPMSTAPPEEKISEKLKEKLQTAHPEERIPVIIELTAPTKSVTGKITGAMAMAQQAEVLPKLQAYDFSLQMATHYVANTLAGTVPAKYVEEIAKDPNVKSISYDDHVYVLDVDEVTDEMYLNLLSQSVYLVDAPRVWKQGYTGKNVVVVIIDTGVDGTHKFLQRNGTSLELEEYSFFSGVSGYVEDHGTHCMGIIASQDSTFRGVAPGIKGYVDIIAISNEGSTYISYLIGALDKAYEVVVKYKNQGYGVVSTNSWGIPPNAGVDGTTLNKLRRAAMNLADTCPTVFAAGNEGTEGIRAPADADRGGNEVITVGAINKEGFVPSWSARGPDKYGDEHNEPDLVAPGVAIISTLPNDAVGKMSGTSMAAPHVAGVVALMLDKNPTLSNKEALNALMSTAEDGGLDGFDYSYGAGIVNAYRAINNIPGGELATILPVGPIQIVSIVFTILGTAMTFKPKEFVQGLLP